MRKNKYVYQTRNTQVVLDVKEQVCLPNVKYMNCSKNFMAVKKDCQIRIV